MTYQNDFTLPVLFSNIAPPRLNIGAGYNFTNLHNLFI